MGSSIRLGRIAGIEFGVNWSWLVVFALIVASTSTKIETMCGGPTGGRAGTSRR
jgi:hypothetical protein